MDNLPKQIGVIGVIWQGHERRYNAANGWSTVYTYKGDHSAVDLQAELLASSGYAVETARIDGTPKSILRIIFGGSVDAASSETTVLNVVWTLNANTSEVRLEDHPSFRTEIDALPDDVVASMNLYIANVVNGTAALDETPVLSPAMMDYIKLRTRRVDSYFTTAFELQRRAVVAPTTTVALNTTNTMKIFTKAQLISLTDIPTRISNVIPDGQYLKTTSLIEQMTDGRFTYTDHWIHGEWRDTLYDLATTPP